MVVENPLLATAPQHPCCFPQTLELFMQVEKYGTFWANERKHWMELLNISFDLARSATARNFRLKLHQPRFGITRFHDLRDVNLFLFFFRA